MFVIKESVESRGSLLSESLKTEGDDSGIEYCEGNRYYYVPRENCPNGISFGKAVPPNCFCVRGIFRAFMSNCEIADGFSMDVCMLPFEQKQGEKNNELLENNRLVSIQVLTEPDWDKSHIVIETKIKLGTWTVFTIGNIDPPIIIESTADYFYVINSKTFISSSTNSNQQQIICYEPNYNLLIGPQICKVTRKLNNQLWKAKSIILRQGRLGGCQRDDEDMKMMSYEPCFKPLRPRDDECPMTCQRTSTSERSVWANCSQALKTIYFENQYQERQMQQHAIISQLEKPPEIGLLEPNRTMELFKILVEITMNFCPDKYIPKIWLDYMINLFYILHRGRQNRYVETLTIHEYNSISTIIEKCLNNGYKVELVNELNNGKNNGCPSGEQGGVAIGYCKPDDLECKNPIPIDPIHDKMEHKVKKRHYVPEVAWNILDVTQAICFREFNESYRMFHTLEQAIEKLFTIKIANFWYHPPPGVSKRQRTLLFGSGADDYIQNLEICTGSAYHIINSEAVGRNGPRTTYLKRLSRPIKKTRLRRKRSIRQTSNPLLNFGKLGKIGQYTEVSCGFTEPKGCRKTEGPTL